MKITLPISLNVPGTLYRPEFLRRAVLFLRALERQLRNPNHWRDRADLGELARELLTSPRCRLDFKDRGWERALAALSDDGSPLLKFAVHFKLPDDVDRRGFDRRVSALFDQLEILFSSDRQDIGAATEISQLARELLDSPRQFRDCIASDHGHVPAFG